MQLEKTFPALKRAISALAVVFIIVGAARALTVIPPTFEEMADQADLVFIGKMVASRSAWRTTGTDRAIFTWIDFQPDEVLKGQAGKTVTLQFLGGTVNDITLDIPGMPHFTPGERVILFVEKNGVQFSPLVGVFHGRFGLQKDEKTGLDVVTMHDGKPLRDVAEIGTGEGSQFAGNRAKVAVAPDLVPMSVNDFKSKLRDHLAKSISPK